MYFLFLDKAYSDNTKSGTEWYIIVVTLVSELSLEFFFHIVGSKGVMRDV